jgi:hypothetical protein
VILSKNAPVGEFIDVRVTGSQVYDLLAEPVGKRNHGFSLTGH